MSEVLLRTSIKREAGWLYFVDKSGNAARVQMARNGHKSNGVQQVLVRTLLKREKGFLYFISKEGHVCRAKMVRKGKK